MIDAVVIGSGPNGLAAAITVAQAGRSVRVYEAQETIGGGLRSAPLTGPGSTHDLCATVVALALASPYLRTLPLERHGATFVHPEIPFAHPLDTGAAAVAYRSVDETAEGLGEDAGAYRRLVRPWVERADALMAALLAPPISTPALAHPWLLASFGRLAIRSAEGLARARLRTAAARALVAGAAAHGVVPLDRAATAGYGLGLILTAHAYGWPVVRGGSQRLADAMASYLRELGGEIVAGEPVESIAALPASRVVLCDVSPRALIRLAGDRMPAGYRRRLERFRHGPGVFKMDWLLSRPVAWRAEACRRAGTVHLGGTLDDIARSERAAWRGEVPDAPYVLVVQPTTCDPTRAPEGRHTLWAYCHVPHGSAADMTGAIEGQIERFAPGFRDTIVARQAMGPAALEARNSNLVGGDIAGGAADLAQILARPVLSLDPHRTPMEGVFLCSSSTPPGVGVHGMCGHLAARSALGFMR